MIILKSVGVVGSYRPAWQRQGIAALDRLLALYPDDPDAHGLRGRLYSYRGEFENALADLEIALERQPTPAVELDATQVYTYTGQPERALPLFKAALESQPALMQSSVGVPLAYAQALRETGAHSAALTVLQRALASQPGDHTPEAAQLRAGLALIYLDSQQPAAALALLEPLRGGIRYLQPDLNLTANLTNQTPLYTILDRHRITVQEGHWQAKLNLWH
ncbi:tetratricopeptide repeat protein [Trichothermofontia sp.]